MTVNNLKVGFIGGGNMATAIISGLLRRKSGQNSVVVCEPFKERQQYLKSKYTIDIVNSSKDLSKYSLDALVLAVKPNIAKSVLTEELHSIINESWSPPIISVVVGITIKALRGWLDKDYVDIIKTMPNTPCLTGSGVIGAYTDRKLDQNKKDLIDKILSSVTHNQQQGLFWVGQESDLEDIVGLSGSSPAYFFYLIELMTKIGKELGFSEELSTKLSAMTMLGSARMILEGGESPQKLRQNVCSPNGSTIEAIKALQRNDLEKIIREAIFACVNRSKEIGKELSK